jgi:hypothetical protein
MRPEGPSRTFRRTMPSPLEHQNVNFLGQYSFALSESVAQRQLRPLRDSEEDYAEAALA